MSELAPTARERAPFAQRRRWLWLLLVSLVAVLLVMLVWLAGRYEASQVQDRLERDTNDAVGDVRAALTRNVQGLQALQFNQPTPDAWAIDAASMLREHRELVRMEWRDTALGLRSHVDTPFRAPVFARFGRDNAKADIAQACSTADRFSGPAYSSSYFVSLGDGLGTEVMDLCLPLVVQGRLTGHLLATYSLQGILDDVLGRGLTRSQEVSFTEADGTRLALLGVPSRGSRIFVAQQLLDLPGNTLVVRMDSRLGAPGLFPNVLTALVTAMSLALLAVLFLLARDMRRRLKVEHDLGEALAFRKAMENSLLTGLRARDLQGRITYVNPAFCKMVGLQASELLNHRVPSPYWPPELASAYQQRQETRLSGNQSPRASHESVFMRQDGTRFPVLIMEAPLVNAVGKHTGWMSAILDVSEQRRIEEISRASQDRLQASARLAMVGEMASLLSHELNQPLAAISSYATGSLNLLQGEIEAAGASAADSATCQPAGGSAASPLFDDLQLAMRRIAEQAERAGKVIKSVHDFVRRRERVREPVAPQSLLDAIMPLVILQSRKLGVQVLTEVDPGCPPVLCDRTMVEQVLLNLSRNGMQAMQRPEQTSEGAAGSVQQDKVLTLRIRPAASNAQSRWVEFAVIDRGGGISAEAARQLFTPFFTTKEEGMGLGLSLCRTVIEQHGGFLGYEASPPQGTIFTFTLPVARARKAGAAAQPAFQESSHGTD